MVVDFEKVTRELKKLKKGDEKKAFKKVDKILSKRLKQKIIVKPSQLTMTIKQREPEPYQSRFFKETLEQEKRSMFFD